MDAPPAPFRIRLARFSHPGEAAAILAVRRAVFIEEQGVPESLEVDGRDPECHHALAWGEDAGGEAVGTARLMPCGRLGRVAVLPRWRRRGAGAALVRALVEEADRRGWPEVELHAQAWTVGFYEALGFACDGSAEFLEAGIPHRRMTRRREEESPG